MIDLTKTGNSWWDSYGKAATNKPAATTGGQTSITKPPQQTIPLQTNAGAGAVDTTGATGGAAMSQGFTNYPSQWQTANNTYTDIANANPQSWGSWYDKAKQTTQYDITDAIRQAVEQAGMGGMRWSESLGRTGQDIAARSMAGLGAQYAQNEMGGYLQNQQNRLAASQGLQGLGQQYAQLPMDVSNNMMNQGLAMQNAYNQQISPMYSMWNQLQPYNSPWLQNYMQMAANSQPQQYQKSAFGSIWDAASSALPFLFL